MAELDGAGDKLFHDESSASLNKDHVEVKFVSPENAKNGDAKINIGDLKSSFAGMGKEELMKFANDPFWVRLRWFLFILFWAIWCGMLFGAIAIIVYAPKCASPLSQEYYDKSPLYEVDVKSFKDGDDKQDGYGDLKGFSSKVDYFKSLGIKQISLSSLLKNNPEDMKGLEVLDFKEIHPTYGTLEDFKDLLNKLKAADIHLLLSFSPDYSSTKHEFFQKSVKKEEPYTNYYVWAPPKGYSSDGTPLAPNNWLSKEGGSAWEWNAERKEFYLHQFGKNQADFNFNNPQVVEYFKEVLDFWLKQGVSGFKLENIEYLLEDVELKNETISSRAGHMHDEYEFYNHQHTAQAPGIAKILDIWGATVHNHTGGVLIVGDSLTENSTHVNLVAHRLEITPTLSGEQLKVIVDKWAKENRITWQWSCADGTLKCAPPALLDALNMVSFLLPGTPITRAGEELGLIAPSLMPWNSLEPNKGFTSGLLPRGGSGPEIDESLSVDVQSKDPTSHLALYKQLVAQRASPAAQFGSLQTLALNNSVFAFTR
ncbi:LOW QUALITY PROTEIN: neutral and basic amino acid transport protein rBAT-like [Diaphorina citri]|uniref:alpha-glucosidase n=1 Tax=Diaphorina citri TaxID=121845 RepID=A0A3Q0J085_DIACI|nr:LOW QUALITY PROTEIN: neutral and basic amino acid transport protein rBAT-like [Diaphorina citri]